jgi:hypothetical protein
MEMVELSKLKDLAASKKKVFKKLAQRLKKTPPRELDYTFQELHEEAFENIDCLDCANCCKTTSPIFIERDIQRISKHLGLKPGDFVEKYLREDEDGDFVLKKSPCAFLGDDNYCSIYEVRPRACREYPHTDRKNMQQIMDLTVKNTRICPAVYRIMERLSDSQR